MAWVEKGSAANIARICERPSAWERTPVHSAAVSAGVGGMGAILESWR